MESKKNRDKERVIKCLEDLKLAALDQKNLLEFSVEAVRARATVGEISMALEEIYGRFEGILGFQRMYILVTLKKKIN